jgi:hypothetical protein
LQAQVLRFDRTQSRTVRLSVRVCLQMPVISFAAALRKAAP